MTVIGTLKGKIMIGRITGILVEKQAPWLMIEVGGIGYEIQAPMTTFYTLPDINQEVVLYTHFVVREDVQALYGFMTKSERSLFRSLIKVSGIGPKLALTILSGVEPDTFVQCIMDNDVATLVRLPGVGQKTAERLVVEMRTRLSDWHSEGGMDLSDFSGGTDATKDALSALISLGYKPNDASKSLAKHKDENLSSEELIRLVLKDVAK